MTNHEMKKPDMMTNSQDQRRRVPHLTLIKKDEAFDPVAHLFSINQALQQEVRSLRQQVETLSEAASQSMIDPLTGLYNRRYFNQRLEEECGRCRREPGRVLSLLMIDVDDFKHINDTLGHLEGDKVLAWVANFLKKQLRQVDICCRYAGDEFVVILPGATAAECLRLVNRLNQAPADSTHELNLAVRISVGFACSEQTGLDKETLVSAADGEMYKTKQARHSSRVLSFLSRITKDHEPHSLAWLQKLLFDGGR